MADFDTQEYRAARFGRTSAADQIRDRGFPVVRRGYDRAAVDAFVDEVVAIVSELEAGQTDDSAVQRRLQELGEETAGILQRAHETADEIAARSRAQADGRLQRAEREAEIVKRDADEYAEQVVVDTRLLWDERQRLIEDIRHLADVVLGTADDAIERLKLPTQLAEAEQAEEEAGGGANVTPIPHPLSIARDPEPDPQSDPSVPYDLELPVEEDPDATVAWGVAGEQDPEATAAWPEEGEEDPETATPYTAEDEYADEEGEQDPDATTPYVTEGEYADDEEQDPDTTAAWPAEADDETAPEDEQAAGDDAGPQTVELEALPGGDTDDQPAEPEPKRD